MAATPSAQQTANILGAVTKQQKLNKIARSCFITMLVYVLGVSYGIFVWSYFAEAPFEDVLRVMRLAAYGGTPFHVVSLLMSLRAISYAAGHGMQQTKANVGAVGVNVILVGALGALVFVIL
jgi:hypothetical protein